MKKVTLFSLALMFVVTISKAQSIPNSSFENWTTHGSYETPDNWGNLNNKTAASSVYTCQKAAGTVGVNCMKLTSKTVGANVANGVAVCGVMDSMTMLPKSGFPCVGRPANLTGKWQHMIYGSSQGSIAVTLTRWDAGTKKRVTVGSGGVTLSGMAMSWASFSVPITYTDASNSDTCIIVMMASGANPTNNDYLWVDNLAFSGTVSGVKGLESDFAKVSAYPNPVTSSLIIDLSSLKDNTVLLQVSDITGKLVKEVKEFKVSSSEILDIADLAKGEYILNINSKEGIITRKFVKE